MKLRLTWLFTAVVLLGGYTLVDVCSTFAQSGAAEPFRAHKVGIVDVQVVMDNYEKCQVEIETLVTEADASNHSIDELRAGLEQEAEDYAESQGELSENDRLERQGKLERQRLTLEMEAQLLDASLRRKKRHVTNVLVGDIVKAVNQIGSEENYHLILEAESENRTGVLYYSTTLNMTQKVIDRLNSR